MQADAVGQQSLQFGNDGAANDGSCFKQISREAFFHCSVLNRSPRRKEYRDNKLR